MTAEFHDVIRPATDKHSATMIWFHGLRSNAPKWAARFDDVMLPYFKYFFPQAPNRAISFANGEVMPGWFDIFGLGSDFEIVKEDESGIEAMAAQVHEMIEKEVESGIPSERIILGGFSQGGAVALYSGLTCRRKLGGIVGLSTFLPLRQNLPGSHKANLQTPILVGHGTEDDTVPFVVGEKIRELIITFTESSRFVPYPGEGHHYTVKMLEDVKAFAQENVPPN